MIAYLCTPFHNGAVSEKIHSCNYDAVRAMFVTHNECWLNDTVLDWHCWERRRGARVLCGELVALMLNQASGVASDEITMCGKSQRGFA